MFLHTLLMTLSALQGVQKQPDCGPVGQPLALGISEFCVAEMQKAKAMGLPRNDTTRLDLLLSSANHYRLFVSQTTERTWRKLGLSRLADLYDISLLSDLQSLEQVLQESMMLAPDDLDIRLRLANTLEAEGYDQFAEDQLLEARRMAPTAAEPVHALARFYSRRENELSSASANRDAGAAVQSTRRLRRVNMSALPDLPPAALSSTARGPVMVSITVNEQGDVVDAAIAKSVPLLDAAALSIVRTWKYEPARDNESRGPITRIVAVNFRSR
jgi:TonB family protein